MKHLKGGFDLVYFVVKFKCQVWVGAMLGLHMFILPLRR